MSPETLSRRFSGKKTLVFRGGEAYNAGAIIRVAERALPSCRTGVILSSNGRHPAPPGRAHCDPRSRSAQPPSARAPGSRIVAPVEGGPMQYGYSSGPRASARRSSCARRCSPRHPGSTSLRSATTTTRGSTRRATRPSPGRCSGRSRRAATRIGLATGVTCPTVIPPGDHRAGRGDARARVRRPVHARHRVGRAVERARRRSRVPVGVRAAGDAARGARDHPPALAGRVPVVPRRVPRSRGRPRLRPAR